MATIHDNSRPVRLGLVGLGGHGRTIQDAVAGAEGLEVAAVFDIDAAEAATAAERFGCDRAASYDDLLGRGDLEAVVLVTPNHLHHTQAEAAFAAGLDVFVEKPIANTVADGQAMVDAADAAGRVLMVGHNMRFGRAARLARQLLDAGRLGRVVSVEIHFSHEGAKHLAPGAWRLRPEQCPLLPVMQLGIHAVDLVHYLLGPVAEVSGYARSVLVPPPAVDSVSAAFRLAGGQTGTMVSNYCTQTTFAYRIAGTEGTLRCTPFRLAFRASTDADGHGDGAWEEHDFTAHDRESYRSQMEAFARAVRTRTAPEVDGRMGLQALAVVEALDEAIRTRTYVAVPAFAARAAY